MIQTIVPSGCSACYDGADVFDLAEWQVMARLFACWIVCDDGAFEKIIGRVAIAGNFAGVAGFTLVRNGPVSACHAQSATPGRRNFRWRIDLLDHQRCDECAPKHY